MFIEPERAASIDRNDLIDTVAKEKSPIQHRDRSRLNRLKLTIEVDSRDGDAPLWPELLEPEFDAIDQVFPQPRRFYSLECNQWSLGNGLSLNAKENMPYHVPLFNGGL